MSRWSGQFASLLHLKANVFCDNKANNLSAPTKKMQSYVHIK